MRDLIIIRRKKADLILYVGSHWDQIDCDGFYFEPLSLSAVWNHKQNNPTWVELTFFNFIIGFQRMVWKEKRRIKGDEE